MNADCRYGLTYMVHICMIIFCITPQISVLLLVIDRY